MGDAAPLDGDTTCPVSNSTAYDRRATGGSGNSTRSNLAGRRTPSGSGEAVPPSVVTKATLAYSPGSLPHAALEGPINSSVKGYPATMKRLLFLAGLKEAQSMVSTRSS
jgi:hypothetical protein